MPRWYLQLQQEPADWGRQVTVCIAAFSTRVNKMVLVSDSKVAFGEFSADKAVVKNVQSTTLRDFTGGGTLAST
jgi:hypothetical protein